MLLPELAKLFGVTIDELFGNTSDKEIVYSFVGNVPWNDDGKLRIAVYSGRKLMEQSELSAPKESILSTFSFTERSIMSTESAR